MSIDYTSVIGKEMEEAWPEGERKFKTGQHFELKCCPEGNPEEEEAASNCSQELWLWPQ